MTSSYDYIVIGSGISGLYISLLAKELGKVLLLTKGSIDDCNTRHAQGGIAAAISPDDSVELHMQDTVLAGAGVSNTKAAKILATDGPKAIAELVRLGITFDTSEGKISLAREGAHSTPRVLHAGGDSTGSHIELTLASLTQESNIEVLENHTVTKIIIDPASGQAIGVKALNNGSGETKIFQGNHTIIATGGAGQLFRYTTNPLVATGDGISLAYNAGAKIMDMEFYQFHPTALHLPGAPPFLISEAVRGEGGVLQRQNGSKFMEGYHALGDLAPRDIVARASLTEMENENSNHVLLDISHLPASRITSRFPNIYQTCLFYGLDITIDPIPVAPAAHYMMGGIQIDTWGVTSVPNLYACGEVACNGVHGANRLASNSLLDNVVFGRRLVERTCTNNNRPEPNPFYPKEITLKSRECQIEANGPPTLAELQFLMWTKVGIVRTEKQLLEASRTLERWTQLMPTPANRPTHELSAMVLLGRLITESAIARTESRGAHYRSDFPQASARWKQHLVIQRPSGAPSG
jgi:L-aspartate oxidase